MVLINWNVHCPHLSHAHGYTHAQPLSCYYSECTHTHANLFCMHTYTVVPRTISAAVGSSPVRVTSSAPQVSRRGFITHGFSLEEERTHRWGDMVVVSVSSSVF